jgi:hypothetical protein
MDGSILVGVERSVVIKKLGRLFGTEPENVEMILGGTPLIIKKNLPSRRAYQYFRTITNAGAACHLEEFKTGDITGHVREIEATLGENNALNGDTVPYGSDGVRDGIRLRNESGRFGIDDLDKRSQNDKIMLAVLVLLIFSLLATVFFIV